MKFFFSVKRIIDNGTEWCVSGIVDGDNALSAYKKAIKTTQEYMKKDNLSMSISTIDVFNKVED